MISTPVPDLFAYARARQDRNASIKPSAGRGITWLLTNSPTWDAAFAPASTAHASHIAADDRRHQPAADADALDDLHVGRLGHRVCRFHQPDESSSFDHSNRIMHCLNFLVA
jgi:hypothetical protein